MEYKQTVFGGVASGMDFIEDSATGLTSFLGDRSNSYEGELIDAREKTTQELQDRAATLGTNAVIGVDIDYRILGTGSNTLTVAASGTAIVTEQNAFSFIWFRQFPIRKDSRQHQQRCSEPFLQFLSHSQPSALVGISSQ